MNNYKKEKYNVLVIGCGGAGLRAAIEVKKHNLKVKVIGKRSKKDAHTVLAAGGINASFGNLDKKDSWIQHFIDTYHEGYSIGDPDCIELMAKNATSHVIEIDNWGANFERIENGKFNQRYFGAHKYRRTCFSGDYTGQSILNALLKKVEFLNIPLFDNEYVTELLVDSGQCFGAISFNINTGDKTIHLADAVILCTGGHTRIWKRSSSRKLENNGDGYYLALKAGCELIDMEMVQFHPTGMLFPEAYIGRLVTEAVRGEGGRLFNKHGERFMSKYDKERMELSTRDIVAIANYTEIMEGRGTPNGGVFLDISHKNKEFIISKIPNIYNQFIETQMVDISKSPMEVAPTAHYSMGGIYVKANDHSTNIKGLYAAGEAAGGLHGANRLGGNSLSEILVFGKIAGEKASEFSNNLTSHEISETVIKKANENIEKLIKKGDQFAINLQNDLQKIMWENCGVIKKRTNLEKGIEKINLLKKAFSNIDICIDNNFNDLINTFDLAASIMTAEATLKSSLERNESRGAHQRSDYPIINRERNYNILTKLIGNNIYIYKKECKKLRMDLLENLKKSKVDEDVSDKLLE